MCFLVCRAGTVIRRAGPDGDVAYCLVEASEGAGEECGAIREKPHVIGQRSLVRPCHSSGERKLSHRGGGLQREIKVCGLKD